MPSTAKLQIQPNGLLGFFQLKNNGQFPQTLASDALVPSVDLLDWYVQANSEVLTATQLDVTTIGQKFYSAGAVQFVVPQGQLWIVSEYTIQVNLVAAELLTWAPTISVPPLTGFGVAVGPVQGQGTAAAAGQNPSSTMDRGRLLFAQPGCALGFLVQAIATAAAIETFGTIRFCRAQL